MKRRSVLAMAALTSLAACATRPESAGNAGTVRFTNKLRIPPLLEPDIGPDGTRRFAVTMRSGRTEFVPGKPSVTWGINGPYLGPTLRAARGDRVAVDVVNRLAEASTLHWHGMRLPAVMDGGPHQLVDPGATWSPRWTVDQPAATLWYHPHPHAETAMHVYRGLAGLFLLDDATTPVSGLPGRYGVDDIPLVVQDKVIGTDGTLREKSRPVFGLLGDTIVINGTYGPFVEVTTTLVRFRILNAANARMFHLSFHDGRAFHVVGTDGGLLNVPVEVDRVSISPGERVEIVVRFVAGEQVILRSLGGRDQIDGGDFNLLKIVAMARLSPSAALPRQLTDLPEIRPPAGARLRRFRLNGSDAINGRTMDMSRIDEVVPAGATEIWEIVNPVYAHNFHIHDAAFRVLDVDGSPPPAAARGRKDTVYVPPKTTVRLAVEFGRHADPTAPYMYHCHLLRHEDKGMMGQFVVVTPGTEQRVRRHLARSGDGHQHG